MRILAGTVFALCLAAGPAVGEDWKEYDYPEQGVAIQFPAKPEAMKSTYDSIYVKGLPSFVISAEDDHVIYKMTVVDLSTRSDMGTNFLNEAANRIERDGEVLFTDFPHVYQGARSVFPSHSSSIAMTEAVCAARSITTGAGFISPKPSCFPRALTRI